MYADEGKCGPTTSPDPKNRTFMHSLYLDMRIENNPVGVSFIPLPPRGRGSRTKIRYEYRAPNLFTREYS
jgi:hypothetical protein